VLPGVNRAAVQVWLEEHFAADFTGHQSRKVFNYSTVAASSLQLSSAPSMVSTEFLQKLRMSSRSSNSSKMAGWYLQKFLKMGLAEAASLHNLGEHYVLWDSTMIMLRDFCPFDSDGRVRIMEGGRSTCSQSHENVFSKLTGIAYTHPHHSNITFSSNHLVVSTQHMIQFLNVLRQPQEGVASKGHWFYSILEVACPSLEDCDCGFPELAGYATWMQHVHPAAVAKVPRQYLLARDLDIVRSPAGIKKKGWTSAMLSKSSSLLPGQNGGGFGS
jgi:hypothetical protein